MAFLQCADCHSPGASNGVGPGLAGIVGRKGVEQCNAVGLLQATGLGFGTTLVQVARRAAESIALVVLSEVVLEFQIRLR